MDPSRDFAELGGVNQGEDFELLDVLRTIRLREKVHLEDVDVITRCYQ